MIGKSRYAVPAAMSLIALVHAQQITIDRIASMPERPQPYEMRDWKAVARGYDSLVFAITASGQYLPLSMVYSNTVNYPLGQSFTLRSYVGSPSFGGEGINCLPAVIGAELVGINKRTSGGVDWVAMCKEWFNTLPAERMYLNAPRASSGDDWWYETMPNVFFLQLYDRHRDIAEFSAQVPALADRWLAAVHAMGGDNAPWTVPNMDHRAWAFSTMTPLDAGVHEPEASGAIGWILYQAYRATGEKRYRIGAELSMDFLNSRSLNPSYELQLSYGAVLAARMNAELGTQYDLQKIFRWCFDIGPLRSWGATVGTWGGYDCSGLIGEINQYDPSYAFLMNTFQQVAALAPIARYDDRFAAMIGKWVLNAANAARLFYSHYLPDSNQDGAVWSHQYDPHSFIAHEAMKQTKSGISPFATGDAVSGGWAETNFALYASSHVGYLAAVVDTTDVPMVLRLDLLATDFGHDAAYPTCLIYNPYDSSVSVDVDAGAQVADLYDAVENNFIANSVSGTIGIDIPSHAARIIVTVPTGGTVTYSEERMIVNGIVADYRSGMPATDHRPRIRAVAAEKDTIHEGATIALYCTAQDVDGDSLSFNWSATHGIVAGVGPQAAWTAPDSEGTFDIIVTVSDPSALSVVDTVRVVVGNSFNHAPLIRSLQAHPRKVTIGATTFIQCNASDDDSDTLSFAWNAFGGSLSGSGSNIEWTAPQQEGMWWVVSTVEDGHGGIARDSVSIEVRDLSSMTPAASVAYYPFNGTAEDASGNGRNGIASNVVAVTDRNGVPNAAYEFNGTTSSVRIPNDNGLNMTDAIAVNFWMTPAAMFSREQYPLSHGNWQNRWKVSITNNGLRWTVKTSSGIKDLDSESSLRLDSTYNVTVQYANGWMELYLNGELDAFQPWSGTVQTTTYDLVFGQSLPNDNNYGFQGVLDDVRIFDGELSLSEISALATRTTGISVPGTVIPERYDLQAFPNPFNPSTIIRLALPAASMVSVRIYDILGRTVATVADGWEPAGTKEVRWKAENVSSGVYFCVLRSNHTVITKKLMLMR